MQTIFSKQTTLGLTSNKSELSAAAAEAEAAAAATKPQNLVSQQSIWFVIFVAAAVSALVFVVFFFDFFSPVNSVLFGTRWTHTIPLTVLPFWATPLILFAASLIAGYFVEYSEFEKPFVPLFMNFAVILAGGAGAAHFFNYDVPAIPAVCAALITVFVVQFRPILRTEHALSRDIRRISTVSHLLEGKRTEARLTSCLELLQTVLPLDEIVVFKLTDGGDLVTAGRNRSHELAIKNPKSKHSEWREGVELCDKALRTNEPTVQRVSGTVGAARIAVPMTHEDLTLGCLLVRFRENFEEEDKAVLQSFAAQLARNFQRHETRKNDFVPSSFDFFSRQAARHRRDSFRVISGLLDEHRFGSLAFGEMVDGYAISYLDGTLAYTNRAMLRAAQITSDRAKQLTLFGLLERFQGGIFDDPRIAVRRVLQMGEPYRCEVEREEPSQTLDLQITLVHQIAEGKMVHETHAQTNTPLCFIITVRDVSAQKENEKLRSDMVNLMSHELRTPITSINGFAELLMTDETISEDSREFLRIISTESQRLSRMLTTFLAVSKLQQSDKREVVKIPIRLDVIVHEVLQNYQSVARKKRIRLVEQASVHLPPVAGDKGLITKAVEHLIDNAIKYSPERTAVTVSSLLEADAVRVLVEDRGYGIPADSLEKIWEKFYRVPRDGQDKDETSTGLGLSFVKEVVERHGGTVQVESEINQGSKFSFTLPRL